MWLAGQLLSLSQYVAPCNQPMGCDACFTASQLSADGAARPALLHCDRLTKLQVDNASPLLVFFRRDLGDPNRTPDPDIATGLGTAALNHIQPFTAYTHFPDGRPAHDCGMCLTGGSKFFPSIPRQKFCNNLVDLDTFRSLDNSSLTPFKGLYPLRAGSSPQKWACFIHALSIVENVLKLGEQPVHLWSYTQYPSNSNKLRNAGGKKKGFFPR